jgi:hypothetical protein
MTDERAVDAAASSDMSTEDAVVSGRVTGPTGTPVAGVDLELYPFGGGADAEPLEAETDSEGAFAFEALTDPGTRATYVSDPDESVLIARYDDWFWSASGDFEPESAATLDIALRNELIFGPEVATSERSRGPELSLLTCWRQVDAPGEQTLFLEVSNVHGADDQELFEVMADTNDLRSGTFSVTVPRDDVRINFGPQTDVGDGDTPPAQVLALATGTENPELENWHPVRTGLPLFGIGSGYLNLSSSGSEAEDGPETIVEGVGRIVNGLPGIGTVLSLADAAEFVIGKSLNWTASLGDADAGFPDPTNPEGLARVPDPNTHTSALLGWRFPDETFWNTAGGSVVMMVPMELEADEPLRATAHAEWVHPTARVTFGEAFELLRATPEWDTADGGDGGESAGSSGDADGDDTESTTSEGDDGPSVGDYAGDDGAVGVGGLVDAAGDFGNGEIDADTMIDVVTSFSPSLPFG